MQFIYHQDCGNSHLILEDKAFHHFFNVRRTKQHINKDFDFANLKDSKLYRYKLLFLDKKKAYFDMLDSRLLIQKSPKTHIIQAVIDNAEFDKTLPLLNELMVEKVSLFYADFSQKNYKINTKRLESILINSCMQCGRLSMMDIEIFDSLDSILEVYEDALALDFGAESLDLRAHNRFIIGPEGGFSSRERGLLKHKASISHPLILRSHTASVFVASIKI